jgi:N-acetylglutamate synthase-like GNAT family acetyltransferase
MEFKVREATNHDRAQMLQVYSRFTKQFVGSTSRSLKSFTQLLSKKNNINYVASDSRSQVIGYVHAEIDKKNHEAEFSEIVVDPSCDFVQVANLLVDKVNKALSKRGVAVIFAGSIRNPAYDTIFPKLGFLESESMGVFMYAVLDVEKLLNELWPVFAARLKKVDNWSGLAQLECDGHSVFFQKAGNVVEPVIWTNQPVFFKVKLNTATLTKVVFGVTDALTCFKTGLMEIETKLDAKQMDKLLTVMFPRRQFLIMDHW